MGDHSREEAFADEDVDIGNEAELIAVLARVDERTKQTNEILERIIEERLNPLEDEVDKIDSRSRRNSLILAGILSSLGAALGALLSWATNLFPF